MFRKVRGNNKIVGVTIYRNTSIRIFNNILSNNKLKLYRNCNIFLCVNIMFA